MATAQARKRPVEEGGTFMVLQGIHFDKGPEGCECDACIDSNGQQHVYEAYPDEAKQDQMRRKNLPVPDRGEYTNDIFESDQDMCKFNPRPSKLPDYPLSPKFTRTHRADGSPLQTTAVLKGAKPAAPNPTPHVPPQKPVTEPPAQKPIDPNPTNPSSTPPAQPAKQPVKEPQPAPRR